MDFSNELLDVYQSLHEDYLTLMNKYLNLQNDYIELSHKYLDLLSEKKENLLCNPENAYKENFNIPIASNDLIDKYKEQFGLDITFF